MLKLSAIYNRGVQVWPTQAPETLCIDSWRCRYTTQKGSHAEVIALLEGISKASLDFTHIELIYEFS